MLKTIFKFLVVIIILIAIGLGVYWFLDRGQGGNGNISSNGEFSIGEFFPFGNSGSPAPTPTESPNTETPDPNTTPSTPTPTPRLWKISNEPQSGAVASTTQATGPFVRFVDKATGNIFESSLRLLGVKRLTNTTIPKVYEAHWLPRGNGVVLRYIDERNDTIKTVIGQLVAMNDASASVSAGAGEASDSTPTSTPPTQNLNGESELLELQTSFLPDNIKNLVINPLNAEITYITETETGSRIFSMNGATPRQVFESPIKDFSVGWLSNNSFSLQTKPSGDAQGFLYYLKSATSGSGAAGSSSTFTLERIIGGFAGLNTLPSPDGTKVFYTTSGANNFASGLLTVSTGETTVLSTPTIKDKCVWSKDSVFIYCAVPSQIPSGKYPDAWYQGRVSFNDTFWRVNTTTGLTEFIIDPSTSNSAGIDAINLMLDPEEQYVIFTNKKDSSLWGLRIQRES